MHRLLQVAPLYDAAVANFVLCSFHYKLYYMTRRICNVSIESSIKQRCKQATKFREIRLTFALYVYWSQDKQVLPGSTNLAPCLIAGCCNLTNLTVWSLKGGVSGSGSGSATGELGHYGSQPRPQVADRGTPSRMDKRVAPDKEGAADKQCLRRRKTLIPIRGRWSSLSLFRQIHLG